MRKKRPSTINQLNAQLYENEVWRNLATAVGEATNRLIDEPRWALENLRQANVVNRGDYMDTPLGKGQVSVIRRQRSNIDPIANTYDFEDQVEVQVPDQGTITFPVQVMQSRDTLIQQASLQGFDYFSDVLQDDDYARLVDYMGFYWGQTSGDQFIKMLSWIKRQRYDIQQLWTEETGHPGEPSDSYDPISDADIYSSLEPLNQGDRKIFDSSAFNFNAGDDPGIIHHMYPTAHVQLSWDIIEYEEIDTLGVLSLFYYLAPIHLVLHRLVGTVYAEADNHHLGVGTQVQTIPQGHAVFDTTAQITEYFASTTQLQAIRQDAVAITSDVFP